MTARRFWLYGKDTWSGPLVMRGGDEYGNDTFAFRLPGGRALVVAWNVPLRRELEPYQVRIEYGLIGGPDGESIDNPLPISYGGALNPAPGWIAVSREIRLTPWEEFDGAEVLKTYGLDDLPPGEPVQWEQVPPDDLIILGQHVVPREDTDD